MKLLFLLFLSTDCSNRQLDISSPDPAKDIVRHAEDQITMETHKEHSMNIKEHTAATIILHCFRRGENVTLCNTLRR